MNKLTDTERFEKAWHVHYFREFGHWAIRKDTTVLRIVKCDICPRYAESHPERFNVEYCRRMGIKFRCGSCLFPQCKTTLSNHIRLDETGRFRKRL